MKAIITAAGPGSRLLPHTENCPKCMLPVAGKSILQRALSTFSLHGIDDVVVVGGWQRDKIKAEGIRMVVNTNYENNNILKSLFYAQDEMDGGFVFSYSDIVFEPSIVANLLDCEGDFVVVADADWRDVYEGRDAHPLSEAELVDVDSEGRVLEMGKHLEDAESRLEFIGMMKVSARGAEILKKRYEILEKIASTGENPFTQARSFEQAYITDMMSDLVRQGTSVEISTIHGGWREIDTEQDLERAMELYQET